jgi:hypothetical protein
MPLPDHAASFPPPLKSSAPPASVGRSVGRCQRLWRLWRDWVRTRTQQAGGPIHRYYDFNCLHTNKLELKSTLIITRQSHSTDPPLHNYPAYILVYLTLFEMQAPVTITNVGHDLGLFCYFLWPPLQSLATPADIDCGSTNTPAPRPAGAAPSHSSFSYERAGETVGERVPRSLCRRAVQMRAGAAAPTWSSAPRASRVFAGIYVHVLSPFHTYLHLYIVICVYPPFTPIYLHIYCIRIITFTHYLPAQMMKFRVLELNNTNSLRVCLSSRHSHSARTPLASAALFLGGGRRSGLWLLFI